jgi:hypothetical protein
MKKVVVLSLFALLFVTCAAYAADITVFYTGDFDRATRTPTGWRTRTMPLLAEARTGPLPTKTLQSRIR